VNIAGQKIAVIGLGKTGKAAVRFLAGQGARVVVTDEKPRSQLEEAFADTSPSGSKIEWAAYDPAILAGVNLVVPSPGIPPTQEIIVAALRQGIPILSELEIASRFLKRPMIAITGTNGKTTTTTLVGHILSHAGRKVFVGGNIGTPLIEYVDGPQDDDYAVVEVSSFQLQWIDTFRPFIAALLNTTSDHVDYHGSFAAYRAAKERIFENQTPSDYAVVNVDDVDAERLLSGLPARAIRFSSTRMPAAPGLYLEQDRIVYCPGEGGAERYPIEMIKIPGRHNVENVMAALAIARLCGCDPRAITEAIGEFKGLTHRIAFAGRVDGVDFYDDSKGTNVDAVQRALETFTAPVLLLMGGRDKEGDFASLARIIAEKAKALILFGEARERIHGLVGGLVPTVLTATMREAVQAAKREAVSGDVVLLSPGCASFDEFKDYKDRGEVFQRIVREFMQERFARQAS
jgi:UDP-N-acetylmuramoylalanine--D-glutamate ligase